MIDIDEINQNIENTYRENLGLKPIEEIRKPFHPDIPVTGQNPIGYTKRHGIPPGKKLKEGIYDIGNGEIFVGDKL